MKATSLNRSPSKPRPALRLISTKELPREDWLQIRKQGIGSSDAAAAVGLNPYKSQLELWMEKTGRDAGLPKADPQDEESPMYWGNVLEPIVAWHYSKRTKNKVRRINAVLQHPDPELPWMLANIDREVIGADDVRILECKTAGINGARLWKEGRAGVCPAAGDAPARRHGQAGGGCSGTAGWSDTGDPPHRAR